MTRLIVAAGGGGDAVAAAMLDAALYGDSERAVILTYAWDRLLIDPVPGPRGTDDSPASNRSPRPSGQCRREPARTPRQDPHSLD